MYADIRCMPGGHTLILERKSYYYYFIINILTAIGLAPGGSSPVHICRKHYIEYTSNAQNT